MKILKIASIVFGTLVGLVGCLPSGMIYPTVTPVPSINHMVDSLMGIKPLWVVEDVYILWNAYDITVDSLIGRTCFLGDLGKRGLYKNFICLENHSGRLLWSKPSGIHRTIAVTPEGIFITYSSPGEVKKFDVKTGDLVWDKNLGGTGSITLTYLNNQIQVSTTNPETLLVLDMDAELIKRVRQGEQRIFLSTPNEIYVNLKGLQVLKADKSDVLWEHTDMQDLRQVPVFTEDKIFLRNGADFSGTAYALDRRSGELLWEIPRIVGNLAYSRDQQLIYALREDGDLLAVDENTGEENVIAMFSPNSFIFFDGIDNCAYQLVYNAEERMLVVYLGDSRQLFAFRVE